MPPYSLDLTLWRIGPLRWWTQKNDYPISLDWVCCNRYLSLGPWYLLRVHWHDGWHNGCEPSWPKVRLRAIRLFTWYWKLPWRYYPT